MGSTATRKCRLTYMRSRWSGYLTHELGVLSLLEEDEQVNANFMLKATFKSPSIFSESKKTGSTYSRRIADVMKHIQIFSDC